MGGCGGTTVYVVNSATNSEACATYLQHKSLRLK